ncbi:EVE domain-containing protein [Nitrincola tibetensis]|uniref:EVE domain-containing protein n=1 Tax=Nitrincola tibetensis TaxID=2219697 RepID=A0A364NLR2_9GAMM|nr:EVE domain-containing protein [Nitrincola tibetensis]RAU18033.1 EVE domain-containing protein [Nitrincola tibetensis]
MNYWLAKTEPDECSIRDFANTPDTPLRWDGVRNYQARNYLAKMQLKDRVLVYHSSCKQIGVAGIVEVTKTAYPDPTQFDPTSVYYDQKSTENEPRWQAVDMRFIEEFNDVLTLKNLKTLTELNDCPLVKPGNRLSVMPLSASMFHAVLNLATGR